MSHALFIWTVGRREADEVFRGTGYEWRRGGGDLKGRPGIERHECRDSG